MSGLRADDIVIYNDADEIPNLNTILFLKHYEGYPQPVEFAYRYRKEINFTWLYTSMNSSGDGKASLCSLAGRTGPRGYIGWRNRFLGSLNVVSKFGWDPYPPPPPKNITYGAASLDVVFAEAEFLDEIQSSKFSSLLFSDIYNLLYSFAVRFLFLQTHATSYSLKSLVSYCTLKRRKEENLIENHTSCPLV